MTNTIYDQRPAERFERVLWPNTAVPGKSLPALSGDLSADVVVVGGGFTGLSAALHLAKHRSVILIDAKEPGFGASGRNAAGFLPIYLDQSPSDVLKSLGPSTGQSLNKMIGSSTKLLLDVVEKYGIEADIRPTGICMGGHQASAFSKLESLAHEWQTYGLEIDVLSQADINDLTGSEKFHRGIFFKDAGTLNPVSYCRGLAAAAVLEGAELYSNTAAAKVQRENGRWRVFCEHGSISATNVLLATDSYPAVANLWPNLENSYYRIEAAMFASRPMPDRIPQFLPRGVPISDLNKTNHFWIMATPEGRLLGSTLLQRRENLSAQEIARPFEKQLRRIYGEFEPIDWEYYWVGGIGVWPKRVPMISELGPQIHFVGGYSGQGITAATAAGKEYANLVADNGNKASCALPFIVPKKVALKNAFPSIVRNVGAPLIEHFDRTYA